MSSSIVLSISRWCRCGVCRLEELGLVSLEFGFVWKEEVEEEQEGAVVRSLVLVVLVAVVAVAEKNTRAVDVLRRSLCMGGLWIVDSKQNKDSAHFLGCCVMLVLVVVLLLLEGRAEVVNEARLFFGLSTVM